MYTYEIWDKETPINGIEASQILENNPIYKKENIILLKNVFNNKIEQIHFESNIRNDYCDSESSIETLAELKTNDLNNNSPYSVRELQEKISTLEVGLANAEYAMMMGGLL